MLGRVCKQHILYANTEQGAYGGIVPPKPRLRVFGIRLALLARAKRLLCPASPYALCYASLGRLHILFCGLFADSTFCMQTAHLLAYSTQHSYGSKSSCTDWGFSAMYVAPADSSASLLPKPHRMPNESRPALHAP